MAEFWAAEGEKTVRWPLRDPATLRAAMGSGQGTGETASAADAAVIARGSVSVSPSELNTMMVSCRHVILQPGKFCIL